MGSWPVGIRVVWVDIIVYFFVIMRAITIIYLFLLLLYSSLRASPSDFNTPNLNP